MKYNNQINCDSGDNNYNNNMDNNHNVYYSYS